jgi:hypothetical protein
LDPRSGFLGSLDRVEELDARLCLAGHGRPFVDAAGHIDANRKLVRERLAAVLQALSGGPRTAVELVPDVYGEPLTQTNAGWLLSQTLCYLGHLEREGRVLREPDGEMERWRVTD